MIDGRYWRPVKPSFTVRMYEQRHSGLPKLPMIIALDLPTILFVLQTSYIAGALALGYARYRSPEAAGAEVIAVGFLALAIGAVLASLAEVDGAWYSALSLTNVTLGMLAYALFLAGAIELSRRRPIRARWTVFLPPALTLAAGLATGFQTINWLRAMVFNGVAGLSMLAAAWVFYRDGRTEPLPARRIVTAAFLTAGGISLAMAAEFGIDRFWPSPALGFVFVLSLKFAIALSVIILTMERVVAKFDRLAHTDMLTGLGNRRSFFATVPAALEDGDAIIIFDADRFKKLNDTWGHAAGDAVLQATARALAAQLRGDDVLARYGGEEFILFLPATPEAEALAIADRMRAAVQATTTATPIRATVSAGLAVCPETGTPLAHLIRKADTALYAAKAAGRNVCRVSGAEKEVEAEEMTPAI